MEILFQWAFESLSTIMPVKTIPQTGIIVDKDSNAHWKVSPFWPLKFDFWSLG